jgi:hypothetical protein
MSLSIFLIHDVLDKPFARQLAIDLSLAGATVLLDEAQIGGEHDSLIRYNVKTVLGDVCLAVILSSNSVRSDWVQHEVESLLNQQSVGSNIKVMPLMYQNCAIPSFMADKICADFRDPVNYPSMLCRVIDCLKLGSADKEPVLPACITGIWQGSWIWSGRQRNAHMYLSSSPAISSKMIIQYLKSGILTIIEQALDVRLSGNAIKLNGTSYRLLERGISLGWNLDTFNLSLDASGKTLEGIYIDKKGVQSPLLFKRK